jgi:hypothetical protein
MVVLFSQRIDGVVFGMRADKPDEHYLLPEVERGDLRSAEPQARCAGEDQHRVEKGSVLVTLGGRLPPTSILSRREFGLRVLRK